VPLAWLLGVDWKGRVPRRALVNTMAATACAVLVVTPWAWRNYQRIGLASLSTSGVANFLIANNPRATRTYDETAFWDLLKSLHYDEAEVARRAPSEAWRWIRSNPHAFLRLRFESLLALLAEDSDGFHWSYRMQSFYRRGPYLALQALAQLWWAIVWFLATVTILRSWRLRCQTTELTLLYLVILACVAVLLPFYNVARYHTPFATFLIVLAGIAFSRSPEPVNENETAGSRV